MPTVQSRLEYREYYPKRTAQYVQSLTKTKWMEIFYVKKEESEESFHEVDEKRDKETKYHKCQRLIARILLRSEDGFVDQTYKFGDELKEAEAGRIYLDQRGYGGTSGYQGLGKVLRGLFGREHLFDLDMDNCHPMLLLFVAKKYGYPHMYLSTFTSDRAAFLAKHGLTKLDVLKGMYTDKVGYAEKPEVHALFVEISQMKNALFTHEEFNYIPKRRENPDTKKPQNVTRS